MEFVESSRKMIFLGGEAVSKIKRASYRPNGIHQEYLSAEKVYQIREMSQGEFEQKYQQYLYCPNPKCKAKLRHHKPYKGMGNPYFATKQLKKDVDNDHLIGCELFFEREGYPGSDVKYTYSKDSNELKITPDRAKKILENALTKGKIKNTKSHVIDTAKEEQPKSNVIRNTANASHSISYDDEENEITKNKAPRIRSVHVDDLSEQLIGKDICVHGNISYSTFTEEYGYINASNSANEKVFAIYIQKNYIAEYEMEYSILKQSVKSKGFKKFACLGSIYKRNGKFRIELKRPWLIEVNPN